MNICFVIGTLNYSGAEKIMFHLIKEMTRRGHEVSVILIASDKETSGLDGVKQYPIFRAEEDREGRIKRALVRQRIIRKIVKENNFDIVVSFGTMFNVDVAEACLLLPVKLILCERNDPIYDPKTRFKRLRRRISYNRGDGFVFQTQEICSFFPKRIQKKSVIIPNFMDTKISKDRMYAPKNKTITTSCRIDNYQKDLTTLFEAFKYFHREYPEYVLELYGDGPDMSAMKKYTEQIGISGSVRFMGRVDDPMGYIRHSTMFVLSSNYEGMPNALIEAMAYGMPCIASDCSGGGARALIKHKENGLLFTVGDYQQLKNYMCQIANDKEFANKIGRNARQINNDLSVEKIIPLWEEFLYELKK